MADRFERLAYRLLGSVEDAEDVVQEARLRLLNLTEPPRNPDAYLVRVVTHLAIDRLRRLEVERRAYVGPWLPEPLVTEPLEAEAATAARQELGVGFLLLLERLSVAERVTFVLREAFGLSFREIGSVLGLRPDACRQRHHRARRKLRGQRRPAAAPAEQRRLLERLVEAVSQGDPAGVAELLADDALLVTDGGGRVSAAIRPVADPARIARVLVHLGTRSRAGSWRLGYRGLNGGVGLVLKTAPAMPYAAVQLEVAEGRISRIYVVRRPDKLTRLSG
jgi:RNA polymerase sigma-70 factor (ECF subfamily)